MPKFARRGLNLGTAGICQEFFGRSIGMQIYVAASIRQRRVSRPIIRSESQDSCRLLALSAARSIPSV